MKSNAPKQEWKTVKLVKELIAKKILDEHHLLMVSNELEHIFEQGKKEGAKEFAMLIDKFYINTTNTEPLDELVPKLLAEYTKEER